MTALPVAAAAAELGVSERQLRRWLRDGAPQARRGGRGRGRAALVDPAAIDAWRRQGEAEAALRALAGEVPELVASAVFEAHRMTEGPHKRALAGALSAAWYLATLALLERLGAAGELVEPEKIIRLRQIFGHSCSVGRNSPDCFED